jgi:hypothetical protein
VNRGKGMGGDKGGGMGRGMGMGNGKGRSMGRGMDVGIGRGNVKAKVRYLFGDVPTRHRRGQG